MFCIFEYKHVCTCKKNDYTRNKYIYNYKITETTKKFLESRVTNNYCLAIGMMSKANIRTQTVNLVSEPSASINVTVFPLIQISFAIFIGLSRLISGIGDVL